MTDTILVATQHKDTLGPKRLEKMFDFLKPEIICLETTPSGAKLMIGEHQINSGLFKMNSPELAKKWELQIAKNLSSKYEVWVPEEYIKQHRGVFISYIDIRGDVELAKKFMDARKLYAHQHPDNLPPKKATSLAEYQKQIDQYYLRDNCFEALLKVCGRELAEKISEERDNNFAKQITELRQKNPEKTIVALLGQGHVYGDYSGNTYNLLQEINPTRFKLIEADEL